MTPCNHLRGERGGEPRHIGLEPWRDGVDVDAVAGCINHAKKLLAVRSGSPSGIVGA